MLKTWSFWKTSFAILLALVGGIQVFADPYISYKGESLKQFLGPSWWIVYYLLPLIIAFSVAALRNAKEETQTETLDQRNRRVMLDHVENFWVKGVLENSLHGAALLELGIKEDPGALSYPWTIKKEAADETLPAGKSMLEIFREIGLGRSLLILGAPGSGKTTMLLELTRQLVERARKDETEPIPVVFNLASWKEKQTLPDWLAEQLNLVYFVPKQIAPAWVESNKMLLLLDGLDEVKEDRRAKCVEVLNQFRTEHGLTPVAVCCRAEEYEAINTKLALEGAIALQPLTAAQINTYIDRFGNSLSSIRRLLRQDQILQELAETPLMLSIMTLAYKDMTADQLVVSDNLEDQHQHLFNTYIERMFQRPTRSKTVPFTKSETLHYLSWLAQTMIRHNIITYQIESMQPSWLEKQVDIHRYIQYVRLIFGLLVGLVFGLIAGPIVGPIFGLLVGLVFGLVFGLLVGPAIARDNRIMMTDRLKWSWKAARWGLLVGLLVGLLGGLLVGLSAGLLGGLSSGLLVVLTSEQVEETTYPGQRLKQTFFNGLISTFIFGLLFGLLGGLSGLLLVGLSSGLSGGLIGGLINGYAALILHYVLRRCLERQHSLPRQLIVFLEYATGLIFLRRVGGSYIFVHRLLMEHFAEMDV